MDDYQHRRSIRLRGYDYRQVGAYFVTLCTHGREMVFGEVVDGTMRLNAYGHIVTEDWLWLAERYLYVDLDAWVLMPNHLHGIVVILPDVESPGEGGSRTAPTKPLGRLVGAFKTVSTKHVNEWRETPGRPRWQRNYYEHVIRNDSDLDRIRDYITANPTRWEQDAENPVNIIASPRRGGS